MTGAPRGSRGTPAPLKEVQPLERARKFRWPWAELALGLASVSLAATNGWWVWTARRGLPYSIDEAGYLQRAIRDGQALVHGGPGGLLAAIRTPDIQAPLVPVLASLAYPFVHANLLKLLISLQIFYVATALATYWLARLVLPRWWALLAALAVACSVGVLDESRSFMFAGAATAMFAAAVAAQVGARNGRDTRLLVLAGVFGGLTMLARTMMVPFIGVLWLIGMLVVVAEPTSRGRRLGRFLLVPIVGSGIAAIWYSAQWRYVLDYLTEFAYGHSAVHYQHTTTLPLVGSLPLRLDNLVSVDLYLPLAALVLIGICLGAWSAARTRQRPQRLGWRMVLEPSAQIALLAVGCLATLCSTADAGSGFELPLVPLLVVLAVAGWRSVTHQPTARILATGVPALVAATSAATLLIITIPALPPLTVTAGAGTYSTVVVSSHSFISQYVMALEGGSVPTSEVVKGPWLTDSWRADTFIYNYAAARGYLPIVFFATEGPLFNTNTLQLEEQARRGRLLPMGVFLDPQQAGMNFVQQLYAPEYGIPNFLVAVSGTEAASFTLVPDTDAVQTASEAGFQAVWRLRLPDATWVTVYWRAVGPTILTPSGGT
jgi:hypothetical protein